MLENAIRRWVENVKVDFKDRRMGIVDWIDLAQDRDQWRALVNTLMNLHVPERVGKFVSSCTTGGLSKGLSSLELVS
jgi:hypothetical protein